MSKVKENAVVVSVVITCYNYGHYLSDALNSVFNQTSLPVEIIVIDDGSTDNTREVTEQYAGKVRYVRLDHVGICAARITGLKEARGRWLIFLDADDALDPDYVEKTLTAWERASDPKPAFVYTQRKDMDTGKQNSQFPAFDIDQLKIRNCVLVSALLDREQGLKTGFDTAFRDGLEDYDFFLSLAETGARGLLVDEALLRVRNHGESRSQYCGQPAIRWKLLNLLLEKHAALYSDQEKKEQRQKRNEYIWRATDVMRQDLYPLNERLGNLFYLVRAQGNIRRIMAQFFYVCFPQMYHRLFMRKKRRTK